MGKDGVRGARIAGLFSACLDAVEKVAAYRSSDDDYINLSKQFDADKHRLRQWVRCVGMSKGELDLR